VAITSTITVTSTSQIRNQSNAQPMATTAA
jgi:hypothetical protein